MIDVSILFYIDWTNEDKILDEEEKKKNYDSFGHKLMCSRSYSTLKNSDCKSIYSGQTKTTNIEGLTYNSEMFFKDIISKKLEKEDKQILKRKNFAKKKNAEKNLDKKNQRNFNNLVSQQNKKNSYRQKSNSK